METGRKTIYTCNDLNSADLMTRCQTAFDGCEALEGNAYQPSCRFRVETCIDQYLNNASSYQIETSRGVPLNYHTPESCFNASVRVTKNLGPLQRFVKNTQESAGPDLPEYKVCNNAGRKDSDEYKLCCERTDVCLSSGPYDIPLGSSSIRYSDSAACLRGVKRLSRATGSARPSEPKTKPAPAEYAEIAKPETKKDEDNTWSADGKKRFEVAFDSANFLPQMGKDNEFRTILLVLYHGDVKGLNINMKYSLDEIGSERYRMRYSITGNDGENFNNDAAIDFETRDSVITDDLVFAITLRKKGNFETPATVIIVKK